MARIKHPHPQLGTVKDRLGGVIFRDGFAEVDLSDKPNLRDAYIQHGYRIEEQLRVGTVVTGSDDAQPFIDLNSLTRAALRDVAEVEGIEYPAKATKAQLVDLISQIPAAPIDDPNAEQVPAYIVPLTPDEE